MIRRLRWRLARLVAPFPIIRDPEFDRALMLREDHGPIAWIAIKTVDVQITNHIEQRRFGEVDTRYRAPSRDGTFSGTI